MKKYLATYGINRRGHTVCKEYDSLTVLFHAGPFSEQAIAESEAKRLSVIQNG